MRLHGIEHSISTTIFWYCRIMQRRSFNSAFALLFFVLLGLIIWFISLDKEKIVQSEIQSRSSDFALNLSETLRLSVESLHTLSNVLAFFKDINYEQFKGVASPYFEADASLLILEWQPIVKGSERSDFVAKIRESGLKDFRLWEPNDSGEPAPASSRNEHVPVLYMLSRNPSGDNVNTLGLDLAWSPERMESKLQARDAGRARVSNFFRVVTGQNTEYEPLGFAITLPVYQGGIVPIDLNQRKEKILGYIAGIYSIEELTKTQAQTLLAEGFNIELFDQFNNENRLSLRSGKSTEYQADTDIKAYGSSFHLTLSASTEFTSNEFHVLWVVLPLSLVLFAAIIFYFLNRLETQNKKLSIALNELEIALREVETLKQREKENIYYATVHSTQHILNNLLNQLGMVSLEIKKNPDFNPVIAESFEDMKKQASELLKRLSSVENIEEQAIKDSVRPG